MQKVEDGFKMLEEFAVEVILRSGANSNSVDTRVAKSYKHQSVSERVGCYKSCLVHECWKLRPIRSWNWMWISAY